MKPQPTHFSKSEGDPWIEWNLDYGRLRPDQIHAIKFDDGSIFDMVNGWWLDPSNRARDEIIQTLTAVIGDLKEFWK